MILALETEPKSLASISSVFRLPFMRRDVDSKIESEELVGLVSRDCLVSLAYLVYVGSKENFLQKEESDSKIESGREKSTWGLPVPPCLFCGKMEEAGALCFNSYTINS